MLRILGIALVLSFLGLGAAQAQAPMWQAAATGCTPYHDALAAGTWDNALGRVVFKGNTTGTMYLVCNVDTSVDYANALQIAYVDPTGWNDANTTVSAALKRVRKTSGAIENIMTVSSESQAGSANHQLAASIAEHTFNHNTYAYYVILTLKRTAAANVVRAISVELQARVL